MQVQRSTGGDLEKYLARGTGSEEWRGGKQQKKRQLPHPCTTRKDGAPAERDRTQNRTCPTRLPRWLYCPLGSPVGVSKPAQRERQLWRDFSRSSGVICPQRSSIRCRTRSSMRRRILERGEHDHPSRRRGCDTAPEVPGLARR